MSFGVFKCYIYSDDASASSSLRHIYSFLQKKEEGHRVLYNYLVHVLKMFNVQQDHNEILVTHQ